MTARLRDPNEVPFFRGTTAAVAAANAYTDAQIATLGGEYEPLGASAAAVSAHEALLDPHPQYLTGAEGDAAYEPVGAVATHEALPDPHPQYLTQAEGDAAYEPAGAVATHEALPDPHSQYALESALGTMAAQNSTAVNISGGQIAGATNILTTGDGRTVVQRANTVLTTGNTIAIQAQMIANPPGVAHTGSVYGAYFTGRTGGAATSFNVVGGCYFEGYHQGAGPVTTMVGVRGQLVNQTSNAAATVTTAISLWANAPFHATPMSGFTNTYGVRIESQFNATWAPSSWGVYQLGTSDRNYFAGRTLVGTLADDTINSLQVAGGGVGITGTISQTLAGVRVQVGVQAGTARVCFGAASAANNWQIDNNNGLFRWYTLSSVQMQLDTSGLLTLPSSGLKVANLAVADATVLDHYQEGTFTPTIVGGTTEGAGVYTVQVGRWQRVGNRVHVRAQCVWTAHTGAGELRLTALPFVAAGSNATGECLIHSGPTWVLGQVPAVFVSSGQAVARCITSASGAASGAVTIAATGDLTINLTYEV